MGRVEGSDHAMQQVDAIIYLILQDSTRERMSMVSINFLPICRLMIDAKILDSKGKKLVKPPYL